MTEQAFKDRIQAFALAIIGFLNSLERNRTTDVIGRQLLRSATSVGANYRAACRARSRAEMISKLAIVEEEADECAYWLELLVLSGEAHDKAAKQLVNEANEILSMTISSSKTLKSGMVREQSVAYDASPGNPKSEIRN